MSMAAWLSVALLAEPFDDRVVCLGDVVEVDVLVAIRAPGPSVLQVFAAAVLFLSRVSYVSQYVDLGVGELRG